MVAVAAAAAAAVAAAGFAVVELEVVAKEDFEGGNRFQ